MGNWKKVGGRPYGNFTQENLAKARRAVTRGTSIRNAAKEYGISKWTLQRKSRNQNMGKPGHPTVFSEEQEYKIAKSILLAANWGFPLTPYDIKNSESGFTRFGLLMKLWEVDPWR